MERGGIVQANQFAQVCEPDAFAVARNLLEDREGAAERLDADALPVLGIVVDIGLRRFDEPCDRGLGRGHRFRSGFRLGSRSHLAVSNRHRDGGDHNTRYSGMTNGNSQCRIEIDSVTAGIMSGDRREPTAPPHGQDKKGAHQ
jgi:hypothetical protein